MPDNMDQHPQQNQHPFLCRRIKVSQTSQQSTETRSHHPVDSRVVCQMEDLPSRITLSGFMHNAQGPSYLPVRFVSNTTGEKM